VEDIPQTKAFYVQGLGCRAGRETARSLILNFYQHQLVANVTPVYSAGIDSHAKEQILEDEMRSCWLKVKRKPGINGSVQEENPIQTITSPY